MSTESRPLSVNRRRLLQGASWAAPAVVMTAAVPAMALSQQDLNLGVMFDGGGGANGYLNSVYFNLGTVYSGDAPYTLTAPVQVTLNVVGLLNSTNDERSFTAGSDYGTLTRGAYNKTTHTTTLTWTLPAGTSIPKLSTGTNVPDILFSFRDGLTGAGRLTNKIVVTSVTGALLSVPSAAPVDSSVVKDNNKSAVSPDGIY